jgi:hypothetical protein
MQLSYVIDGENVISKTCVNAVYNNFFTISAMKLFSKCDSYINFMSAS